MTMVMLVSKSKFKARALEYLRHVESTRTPLIITDRGKPVVKIVPYAERASESPENLRNTLVKYDHPTDPVSIEDWEILD